MTVVVNGRPRELAAGVSLAELVGDVHPGGRGVAVAVAGEVVPRGQWPSTVLSEGDVVELVTAVQGG